MILPDKHIWLSTSLLNTGAVLLRIMKSGQTVTEIWDVAKTQHEVKTFDKFVNGMDLLFILGAVRVENGLIIKSGKHADRRPEPITPKESSKMEATLQ